MLGSKNYIVSGLSNTYIVSDKSVTQIDAVKMVRIDGPKCRMTMKSARRYDATCKAQNARVELSVRNSTSINRTKRVSVDVEGFACMHGLNIAQWKRKTDAQRRDETSIESCTKRALHVCSALKKAQWKLTMCKGANATAKWSVRVESLRVVLHSIECRLLSLNSREVNTLSECKGTGIVALPRDAKHARKARLEVKGTVSVRVAGRPSLGHIIQADYFNSTRAIEARCWQAMQSMDCGY